MEDNPFDKYNFPPPEFHGIFKQHISKYGFIVEWFNADKNAKFSKPGIHIRIITPDKQLKEEKFFSYDQTVAAEQEYQKKVKQISDWDSIKP